MATDTYIYTYTYRYIYVHIYIYISAGDEHGQLLEKVRHSLIEVLKARLEPVGKKRKLMEEERLDELAEDLVSCGEEGLNTCAVL